MGDSISLLDRRLGYILNLNWGSKHSAEKTHFIDPSFPDGDPSKDAATDVVQRVGKESVAYGALGSISYRVADGQDLSLTSFYTSDVDDVAAVQEGYRQAAGSEVRRTRLQILERSLLRPRRRCARSRRKPLLDPAYLVLQLRDRLRVRRRADGQPIAGHRTRHGMRLDRLLR